MAKLVFAVHLLIIACVIYIANLAPKGIGLIIILYLNMSIKVNH